MKSRVSAVIIQGTKILLMHRYKPEKGEYYVLPGGKMDENETLIDALKREIKEETNLDILEFEKVAEFENVEKDYQPNFVYLINKFEGKPKIIGEEATQNNENNKYELKWIELRKLSELPLKPDGLLEQIF